MVSVVVSMEKKEGITFRAAYIEAYIIYYVACNSTLPSAISCYFKGQHGSQSSLWISKQMSEHYCKKNVPYLSQVDLDQMWTNKNYILHLFTPKDIPQTSKTRFFPLCGRQ